MGPVQDNDCSRLRADRLAQALTSAKTLVKRRLDLSHSTFKVHTRVAFTPASVEPADHRELIIPTLTLVATAQHICDKSVCFGNCRKG